MPIDFERSEGIGVLVQNESERKCVSEKEVFQNNCE